ncbi:nucleoside-diphosphate sugar epimerase [Lutibacter sp.]|uniref:nucleoside-diphosphate sugar epimerase n=1 Tax=Lutibacter sp. TaxID=1925666 RepID=UPI001A293F72|nr:nucleoside-diphosphate sugar epimerase [Lutibacter sp.]MBI9040980.1 nucleoside-diphosphate sugar epimerase [Lutibacter sp.]
MKKTAIILGATGLTGSILLEKLINDDRYESIKLFSRTKIDGLPKKVQQFIGNILELESFKDNFKASEVFCCIGTTANKTPNKETYKRIDFGIPVTAAKLSKLNSIPTFIVVSAMGANAKSSVFYNKTKGEMELGVLQKNITNTYILRPSIIGGERKESRLLEKIGLVIFKVIQPLFIGKLKQYKIIEAKEIAQAMLNLANSKTSKEKIINSDKIREISKIKNN